MMTPREKINGLVVLGTPIIAGLASALTTAYNTSGDRNQMLYVGAASLAGVVLGVVGEIAAYSLAGRINRNRNNQQQ